LSAPDHSFVDDESAMEGRGAEEVKPLVSAAWEYRSIGLGYLAVGIAFGFVAVLVEPPLRALFSLSFCAVFFGAAMYLFAVRRNVAAAVESPLLPPTTEREARGATVRRVVLGMALTSGALMIVVLVFGRPAFAGGAALGMGGALISASHWLGRWQRDRSALVLREPRFRWSGGGIADQRDFYVVESP
jgi:hypothetical protein